MEDKCYLHTKKEEATAPSRRPNLEHGAASAAPHQCRTYPPIHPPAVCNPVVDEPVAHCVVHAQVRDHVPAAKCPHGRGTTMVPIQVFGCAPPLFGAAGMQYMVGSGKVDQTYVQLAQKAKVAREKVKLIHSRAKGGIHTETQKRLKQMARACDSKEDNSLACVKDILGGPHNDLAKQAEIMALFSAKLHYYETALTDALDKLGSFKENEEGQKQALQQCEGRLRDLQEQIEKNNDQQRHVSSLLNDCLKSHECEIQLEEKSREIKNLQGSLFRSSIEKDKIKSQKDRVEKVLEQMAAESKQGAYINLGAIPILFESAVSRVKATSETFTKIFLMAMKKAKRNLVTDAHHLLPGVYLSKPVHIVYVFQAYISNQMFLGFEDANFCLDDTDIEKDKKRRGDCFMQFSHMGLFDLKEDDPFSKDKHVAFQKFCCNKFMAVVPPWLERALFKDLRNREKIDKGEEPQNEIYEKLKELAASIWLLHRLATSFKPSGTIFRVRRGADVDPDLMELVVPKEDDKEFLDKIGFMIIPGFEVKGTTIKALVYLEGPEQTLEQLLQQASSAAGAIAPAGGKGAPTAPATPAAAGAPGTRRAAGGWKKTT